MSGKFLAVIIRYNTTPEMHYVNVRKTTSTQQLSVHHKVVQQHYLGVVGSFMTSLPQCKFTAKFAVKEFLK